MDDSGITVLRPELSDAGSDSAERRGAAGALAEVVPFGRPGRRSPDDAQSYFVDTLAEYRWARDAAGLAPGTLENLIQPIIEIADYFETQPWNLAPQDIDRYFAGPGKHAPSTVRGKMQKIDGYFAFLEQRYGSEIHRRFGVTVSSPIDAFNRSIHRGDFELRVPPSRRDTLTFFSAWRDALPHARKPYVASRNYVMAKLAYISGVRAAELCGVGLNEIYWDSGQWGRFLVRGKGHGGSGPRKRLAFLFADGRELLWWYVEEVRGGFADDPSHPQAPLFPSERLPKAVSTLGMSNAPGSPITPATFRDALSSASAQFLPGPVSHLYPHLLRHACATHNYERGMGLWEVQKLLGHERASTTVGYLATAAADPEMASRASAERVVQRLRVDEGRLR